MHGPTAANSGPSWALTPSVMTMVTGMKSHNVWNLSGAAYPFGSELAKLNIADEEVAMVDIAGGQGHVVAEIRQRYPHVRGRFIVQDLHSTFDAVDSPPVGVEFMPYDIFTPQAGRAHVYYYRHIVHDWNDEDCGMFLRRSCSC
jgi:hypothetical protein